LAVTKNSYQSAQLRASSAGQEMYFAQSVLRNPEWESPQFNGRFFVK